jgi:hypothetical protein
MTSQIFEANQKTGKFQASSINYTQKGLGEAHVCKNAAFSVIHKYIRQATVFQSLDQQNLSQKVNAPNGRLMLTY